jgi:heme-degrading monooxygenase HmoA
VARVTFFRFRAQPGKRQAVIEQFNKWEREQKSKATGFQRSVLVSNNDDPDEFIAGVRFDTEANYTANSERAEQGQWFEELRANLVADPDWFNGSLEREVQG